MPLNLRVSFLPSTFSARLFECDPLLPIATVGFLEVYWDRLLSGNPRALRKAGAKSSR
jgi:hypothetical protein